MSRFSYAAALAALIAVICAPQASRADTDPAPFKELNVRGETAPQGIYDPSIEYAPDGTGWLAYSAVTAGPRSTVETRIARSVDGGRTWVRAGRVNSASPAEAHLPKEGRITGAWWHEVPTLAHDPGDKGREWKLFWHRYLARYPYQGDDDRMFALGWIAMRWAASPEGPWSKEIPLIGAGPFPFGMSNTRFKIQSMGPDFAPYIVLTEPGALAHKGRLYLVLQAFRLPREGQPHSHDIVLLRSDDHGQTWHGIGRLLAAEEARAFGAKWFTGPALGVQDGRVFLMVTPEMTGRGELDHNGTLVLEFDQLDHGTLRRGADGKLKVIKRLLPTLAKGGQADFHESHPGGMVVPQVDLRNLPRAFRIFETGQRLID